MEKKIDNLKAIVNACDRCGACTLVCPLYQVRPMDRSTSRGKIALTKAMLAGTLSADNKELREAMEFCLLCGACTDVCPSKVLTAEAMMEMRDGLGANYGVKFRHRAIGKAMASTPLKTIGRQGIALAQRFQLPRYSGGLLPSDMVLDHARSGPVRRPLAPAPTGRSVEEIKTIAYFQGCAMGLFFPEAAKASQELLRATGREVIKPNATCCGVPQEAHGQMDHALKLAKENISRFQNADAIITDCGSCGAALASYGIRLNDDPQWAEAAGDFSRRIWSLSEFLDAAGYEPRQKREERVVYHDSCHLNRGRRIHDAPRRLLRKAGNYIELDNAEMCCGGAGSFQLDYPDISKSILELKYDACLRADADLLVTECPSCLMQLGKLNHRGKLRVLHISQVLR